MLPKTDDKNTELKRYLDSVKASEVKPIPKKPEPEKVKETPKNDDFNEYDYSDDRDIDDKEW